MQLLVASAGSDPMSIRRSIGRLASSPLMRSVGILVSGTALGQVIVALALPIATRLYTPQDFAVLAVFSGVLSLVSVAACLRMDLAVPLPKREVAAINIAALAVGFAFLTAAVIALIQLVIPFEWVQLLNQPGIEGYLWLLAPGLWLAGCYSTLQFWFVRKKAFVPIAQARVGQSAVVAGTQIGCGWFLPGPAGLIVAQVFNSGIGSMSLAYRVWRGERSVLRGIRWSRMRAMLSRYDRFPKFSTFEALSNSAGIHLPIILISALAAGPDVGFLVLAMLVIQAPMGLVGGAVAQVYMSRAPEENRAGRLGSFTAQMLGGLLKTGVGPLIALGMCATGVFGFIFGPAWERAGTLTSWMTPWFVLQFLSFPLSMALHVAGRQRAALVLQLVGLAMRMGFVVVADIVRPDAIAEAYALSGLVFYLLYLLVLLRTVGATSRDLAREIRSAFPVILGWVAAGAVVLLSIEVLVPGLGT